MGGVCSVLFRVHARTRCSALVKRPHSHVRVAAGLACRGSDLLARPSLLLLSAERRVVVAQAVVDVRREALCSIGEPEAALLAQRIAEKRLMAVGCTPPDQSHHGRTSPSPCCPALPASCAAKNYPSPRGRCVGCMVPSMWQTRGS